MESDVLMAGLFVEGEISNFNAHSSGHLYFTLKDDSAGISGVMFKGSALELNFIPKNGMKVIAFGRLSLYETTGQYQIYVEYLEPAGTGGLQLAFAQLCEKLQKEGLFEPSRKREIPVFAKCVAVITSPTGAAVQDIIRIIQNRNPVIKIVIAPAMVQGSGAAEDLSRALAEVNAWGLADVIILGRGGGSTEDLWAFNEEVLARAVAKSKIPVVSAVGHETDFTITDYVADLRAPTPTAAAQMVSYDHKQTMEIVHGLYSELTDSIITNVQNHNEQAHMLLKNLHRHTNERISQEWLNLNHQQTLLEKVSPYTAFRRGYALIRSEKQNITSAKDIKTGQNITLHWADGYATAEIKDISHE